MSNKYRDLVIGTAIGLGIMVAGQEIASYETAGRIIDCAANFLCFAVSEETAIEKIFKPNTHLGRYRVQQYLRTIQRNTSQE